MGCARAHGLTQKLGKARARVGRAGGERVRLVHCPGKTSNRPSCWASSSPLPGVTHCLPSSTHLQPLLRLAGHTVSKRFRQVPPGKRAFPKVFTNWHRRMPISQQIQDCFCGMRTKAGLLSPSRTTFPCPRAPDPWGFELLNSLPQCSIQTPSI